MKKQKRTSRRPRLPGHPRGRGLVALAEMVHFTIAPRTAWKKAIRSWVDSEIN